LGEKKSRPHPMRLVNMIDRCCDQNLLLEGYRLPRRARRLVNVQLVKLIDISMQEPSTENIAESKTQKNSRKQIKTKRK